MARMRWQLLFVAVAAVASVAAAPGASADAHAGDATYQVTEITHPYGDSLVGWSVNSHGDVVGTVASSRGDEWIRAFHYTASSGGVVDLDLGKLDLRAAHLNDDGVVVVDEQAAVPRSWRIENGRAAPLPGFGIPGVRAYAIDAKGQIAGSAVTASGVAHAFLQDGDKVADLGGLSPEQYGSRAYDVDDSGVAVGVSELQAVVFLNGAAQAVAVDPMSRLESVRGKTAVGFARYDPGKSSPWRGLVLDLDTGNATLVDPLPGDDWLRLVRVNRNGVAVGLSGKGTHGDVPADATRPVLYRDGKLVEIELDLAGADWKGFANDVNDAGQIVVDEALPDGRVRTFLLTPTGATPPAAPTPGQTVTLSP